MELLNRIKKLASILLLICLFLPLSQCTQTTSDGKETITVHYGYKMLTNSVDQSFNDGVDWDLVFGTLIYFSFFFTPLIILALKIPAQQIAAVLFTFPAGYITYIHLFTFTPRIGIWLAAALWAIIAIASFTELYYYFKQRMQNKIIEHHK